MSENGKPEHRTDAGARCTHQQLSITEHIECTGKHIRREDGTWWHNNEPGGYNQRLDVVCFDCGHKGRYWRGGAHPRWLKQAFEELSWPT